MATWLTPQDVATWANANAADMPGLATAVTAAVAYVERKRSDLPWADLDSDPPTWEVPGDLKLGTIMLANRLQQRYGTPLGTTGYPDQAAGGILRHDPDIAKLCGLGASGRFVFGSAPPPVPVEVTP